MKRISLRLTVLISFGFALSVSGDPSIPWKKYDWASNSKGLITSRSVPQGAEVRVRVISAGEGDVFALNTLWGTSSTEVSHWSSSPSKGQVLKHRATTSDKLYFTIGGGNYTQNPISVEMKEISQVVRFKGGWTIEIKIVEEEF